MIVVKPLGTITGSSLNLFNPTKLAQLGPGMLPAGMNASVHNPAPLVQANVQEVARAAQAEAVQYRTQCETACNSDPNISQDPEANARCISICLGTQGNTTLAIENARKGSFCAAAYDALAPQLGDVAPGDIQTLFESCVDDVAGFIQQAKSMGLDTSAIETAYAASIGAKPWYKQPAVWILGGGAALLGLIAYRRFA